MDKDEALKLALEALEGNTTNPVIDPDQAAIEDQAINVIKQALAAPVQEPVGRVCFEGDEVVWTDEPPESGTLLYTTPPAAPVQEPVAWRWKREGGEWQLVHQQPRSPTAQPLYTTPPAQPAPVQEPVAWTAREIELIDGMIRVQMDHAERCDHIGNRTMAERQKGWDMERVALLQKVRATPPAAPPALVQQPATLDEMHAIGNGIMYGEQPAPVPDKITDNSEHPGYKAGWNDCRELMLSWRKP